MLAVDRLIAAPSSAAWNVLVDLDAWPQWGPTVSGARLDSPHTELSLGATGMGGGGGRAPGPPRPASSRWAATHESAWASRGGLPVIWRCARSPYAGSM